MIGITQEGEEVRERFGVDNLFLLVGTNPLPNAVAASLLLKPNGRLFLVHTAGVRDHLERLQSWINTQLKQTLDPQIRCIEIDHANALDIETRISAAITDNIDAGASVGLNYTGGTKAMAAHAHRAVKQATQSELKSLSYLDAQSLSLLFDPGSIKAGPVGCDAFIGKALKLELSDLLALHGWEFKNDGRTKIILPNVLAAVRDVHTDPAVLSCWQDWQVKQLLPKTRRCHDDVQKRVRAVIMGCDNHCVDGYELNRDQSDGKLNKLSIPFPTDTTLEPLATVLREAVGQTGSALALRPAADQAGISAKDFGRWLEGDWLESLVLEALQGLATDAQLHDLRAGFEPITNDGDKPVKFEFDVAAMRGYQLFAFSCTTDASKPVAKGKLFEAIIRARQFGGDEARIALVCLYDDPKLVTAEVSRDLGIDSRQIRTFGLPHLKDLGSHIKGWLDQN